MDGVTVEVVLAVGVVVGVSEGTEDPTEGEGLQENSPHSWGLALGVSSGLGEAEGKTISSKQTEDCKSTARSTAPP